MHQGIKEFKCDFCTKSFTQSGNLETHKTKIHNRDFEKDKHKCDICSKTFLFKSGLKSHIFSHTDKEKSMKCNVRFVETLSLPIVIYKCTF